VAGLEAADLHRLARCKTVGIAQIELVARDARLPHLGGMNYERLRRSDEAQVPHSEVVALCGLIWLDPRLTVPPGLAKNDAQ
jgi:hypothetical protein